MQSSSSSAQEKPLQPVNIVGFDWDNTLLRFHSQGFLFLLGDDNKDYHKALRPALLQLMGDAADKKKFLIELKSKINDFFIHTMGTEVELVNEKGDPLPPLFYSGKQAVIKYLEALFGDEWRTIIPEESIHALYSDTQSNPIKKSKIAFSHLQYKKLQEKIVKFRETYLKEMDGECVLSEEALNGSQLSHSFLRAHYQLVEDIETEANIIHFYKQLKPQQQNLFGKGIHLFEAIDTIIERYRQKGIEISIENLFMVDDDEDNCSDLAALRHEFRKIKRLVSILHKENDKFTWKSAVSCLLSTDPADLKKCEDATFPERKRSLLSDKYFYTDYSSEVKAGHWESVKRALKRYENYNILDSKLEEISSHIIDIAAQANEIGNQYIAIQKEKAAKVTTPAPSVPSVPEITYDADHPLARLQAERAEAKRVQDSIVIVDNAKLVAMHKTFIMLIDRIIKLIKDSSSTSALKICHEVFSHPEVKACFTFMDKHSGSSIIEYLLNNLFLKRKGDYYGKVPSKDDLETDLSAPHSTLLFLLENVKETHRIHNPKMCEAVSRVIKMKKDPLATTQVVKRLVEDCQLDPAYFANIESSLEFYGYMHPLMHAIGMDPESRSRFALCQYLISKGVTLDNKLGSRLLVQLIEARDLQAIQFFCENTKVDLCLRDAWEGHEPLRRAFDLLDFNNPNPESFAIFEYLITKEKFNEYYLVSKAENGDEKAVKYLCEKVGVSSFYSRGHKGNAFEQAVKKQHLNIAKHLLKQGCFNINGHSEADAEPKTEEDKKMARMDAMFGKKYSAPLLITLLANKDLEGIKFLCENGADIHIKDSNGKSILDILTMSPDEEKSYRRNQYGEGDYAYLFYAGWRKADKTSLGEEHQAILAYLKKLAGLDKDVAESLSTAALNQPKESTKSTSVDEKNSSLNSFMTGISDAIDDSNDNLLKNLMNAFNNSGLNLKAIDKSVMNTNDTQSSFTIPNLFENLPKQEISIPAIVLSQPSADIKPNADEKQAPISTPVIKQDKKSDIQSAFDPLLKFVMHLASHGDKVDKKQMDEILHYARWYLKTGGTIAQLTQTADDFFAGNKTTLVDAVRELTSALKSPAPFKPFSQMKKEFEETSVDVKITLPQDEINYLSDRFQVIDRLRDDITALNYHDLNARITASAAACKLELKETNKPSLHCAQKDELLALLRETYWRTMGIYPNDVQMFNVMALINDPQGNRLAQIKTGEGKSTIMALLSSYYALLGIKPDVVTTHDNLAERDVEKLAPFYNALGLKVAYVDEGCKTNPNADVLYGTFHAYESLWLGKETGRGSSRGDRPYHICLVDEADNLFIDNKQTSLRYLFGGENNDRIIRLYEDIVKCFEKQPPSQSNPVTLIEKLALESGISLGTIRLSDDTLMESGEEKTSDANCKTKSEAKYLYEQLWKKEDKSLLNNVKDPNRKEFYKKVCAALDEQVSLIKELNKASTEANKIPGYVDEYEIKLDHAAAKKMFNEWVDAKYHYKEGVDYRVVYKSEPHSLKTKPVEIEFFDWKNTGQLQHNMRYWTMHTFLEIMHKVPPKMMESIVCRTNHLSYMKKYQYGCKCVTGTAGQAHDRHELSVTCGINTYDSPPNRPNIKKAEPAVIVEDAQYNATLIKEVSQRRDNKQPVVIFVESVKQSEELTELFRKQFGQDNVQYYNAVQKEMPESIVKQAAAPGMVTVVTNIGGRGMDISATDENPLHLIFTNLFANRRVESQAIGRTGRQGRKGSYNYVLSANRVCQDLRLAENEENIARLCNRDADVTIFQWYAEKEMQSISNFSVQLASMYLDDLVEDIQHVFMMLPEQNREDNMYRWAEYISAMDHIYSKEFSEDFSIKSAKEKGTKLIVDQFIEFWKSCHLNLNALWDILDNKENIKIRNLFHSLGHKRSETISDLRANSLYQPNSSKEIQTISELNLTPANSVVDSEGARLTA